MAEERGFSVYISSEKAMDDSLQKYQLKIDHRDIHHLMAFASLLVSDSQSMSVEAAMLGTPSLRYSDFSGRISVLEELEQQYHLTFGIPTDSGERLIAKAQEILSMENPKVTFQARRKRMLEDKIDVTAFITWFVEEYPKSHDIMQRTPDYQNRFK
jgi:predicted glycosyltransferase